MSNLTGDTAPQFSIIIPAFNCAATIAMAIESVRGQNSADYEIIVANDGSTDETASILQGYQAAGLITAITQDNRGPASARNAAARLARGRWLAFLDADDTWLSDKLQKSADAISRNPEAVLLFSDANCVSADGQVLPEAFMPAALAHPPSWDEMMVGQCQILTSAAVVKRAAFEAVGGFNSEFSGIAFAFEDVFLWLQLREQGPFLYLSERLVNYCALPMGARLQRYRPGFAVFARLVRERYGREGEVLIAARRKARVTRWGYLGLTALNRGELKTARQAFRNALVENPKSARNLLRLLRTYLPRPLIRALTGRTREQAPIPPHQ